MSYLRNYDCIESGTRVLCRDRRHGIVLDHAGPGLAVHILEDESDEIISVWHTNISGTYDVDGNADASLKDYQEPGHSKPDDPKIPKKTMTRLKKLKTKALKARKEA